MFLLVKLLGNTTINAIFPEWVLDDFKNRIRDPKIIKRLRREFAMFRLFLGLEYSDIRLLWGYVPELEAFEGLHFGQIAKRLGISQMHVSRLLRAATERFQAAAAA